MKGYWIVRVNVINLDGFKQYLSRSKPAVEEFGGKYIVRGGEFRTIDGEPFERHVIIEFESYKKAVEFYNSKKYQEIKTYREKSAEFNLVIVEGA